MNKLLNYIRRLLKVHSPSKKSYDIEKKLRQKRREGTTPTNWSSRYTTEGCFCYEYYYGEIDQCMYGEPDVPDNLVRKCKLIE